MYYYPHKWTLLHLLCIFQTKLIAPLTADPEFKSPFLVDRYGKTPLHYVLAHEKLDFSLLNNVAEYMLRHLQDENCPVYERQITIDSITNILALIMDKLKPALTVQYLKLFSSRSSDIHNYKAPEFGKPVKKKTFSTTPVVDSAIEKRIYKRGEDEVQFKTLALNFDYNPRSEDMLEVAFILATTKNEDFLRTQAISNLVDHLWDATKFTNSFMALWFSIMMILFSVYIGVGRRILGLEITIIVMVILAFGAEIIQMKMLKEKYFESLWNWIDLVQLLLTFAFIVARFCNFDNNLARSWVITFIIILGYVRWISYLRLFTPTSKC